MRQTDRIAREFGDYGHPVFRSQELSVLGIGAKYKKRLVHLMLGDGRITRITRGVYTLHRDADVVGFAFQPFYYGLEDALSIRKLSAQGTNPVVLTLRNVRQGTRTFRGRNYMVKRIPQRLFFGYGMVKRGGFWLPVSDVEKTVIDMLYFGDPVRDELLPAIVKEIDRKRFASYLERYDPRFRKKAAAFLTAVPKARRQSP